MQKVNKKYLLLFLAFMQVAIVLSQNIALYKTRYKKELSIVDNNLGGENFTDVKYHTFGVFDTNASFRNYLNNTDSLGIAFIEELLSGNNFKNNVFFSASSNFKHVRGTSLPQFANEIKQSNFLFTVDNYFENIGTVSALFLYRKGTEKGYSNNIVIHPEIYYPYLIDVEENALYDKKGRKNDFINEVYILKSDYGFKLFNMDMGIGGKFMGEKAHQKTDPRGLNTFSSLGFNIGGLKKLKDTHLFSLSAGYTFSKQYITVQNWQIGRKDKFLPLYGFDHYDLSSSEVLGLHERMYYNEMLFAELAYTHQFNTAMNLSFGMNYSYDSMSTEEENSMINLFAAGTHSYNPAVNFTWKREKDSFYLSYKGGFFKRNGKENIYMPFRPNPLYDIYDYDKIESLQLYNLLKLKSSLQAKYGLSLSASNKLNFLAAYSQFKREEKYNDDVKSKIENGLSSFCLGFGYDIFNKKHEFSSLFTLFASNPFSNSYDVYNGDQNLIQTPVSFLTYRYYNKIERGMRTELTYAYKSEKFGTVGLTADVFYSLSRNKKEEILITKYNVDETYLRYKGNDLIVNLGLFICF